MKIALLSAVLYFYSTMAFADAASFDHNFPSWNKVLAESAVKSDKTTKVKYHELVKNPADLNAFVKEVESVTPAQYNSWNEKQKLAFLFNSYNALTIKLIVEELTKDKNLKSIKKIGGVFTSAWKMKYFKFLGKESSLDEIEHELARPNFDEPRMHFAFNCASISCPSLHLTPFIADKLDEQLEASVQNFLSDSSRNELNKKNHTLALSSIFKWYKEDFENSKKLGPLKKFLLARFPMSEDEKKQFAADKFDIKYLEYNWNLNIWVK